MRRTAAIGLVLHASCGVLGEQAHAPCPPRLEYDVALHTSAPVLELTLVRAPRVELFPAIGGHAPWGVERVDLALRTDEPLDVVLSADGTLHREPVVIERIAAGESLVSLHGPLSAGHLLLVRPPDSDATPGSREPLRVEGRVRVSLAAGATCEGLHAARLRSALPRCGNGRLELGEACDDGNDRAGDGCHACRIEPPRCAGDREGPEALRPWACIGEPSQCEPIGCEAGASPPCRDEIRIDVHGAIVGRVSTGDPAALQVTGDVACAEPGAPDEPRCAHAWPVCTPLSLEAVPGTGTSVEGWRGACETSNPLCRIEGAGSDVSAVATAVSSPETGVDWLVARPVQVHDADVSAGPEGTVALTLATTVASVTKPQAGGFVHRRAAQVAVYEAEGRFRFERRLGGRAVHVRSRAAAALGDGGVLLVAAFPDDFPLFPQDAVPRRAPRRAPARPRMVLRVVRFSAEGDPVWVHDLGEDGSVRIALADEHAWIAVTRPGSGHETELFDIDPRGTRRWKAMRSDWNTVDLVAAADIARAAGLDASGVLRVMTLGDGEAIPEPIEVQAGRIDPSSTDVSLSRDRVVVARTEPGRHGSTAVAAFDPTGSPAWARLRPSLGACGAPMVRDRGGDELLILQPSCELDGRPSGFVVDRVDADGRLAWRHRMGGPGSGALGVQALAMTVDEGGRAVIVGRSDRATRLQSQDLLEDGVFVMRLEP